MTQRRRRALLIAAVSAAVACVAGPYTYSAYRRAAFLRELHLVGFSTSMVSSPRAEQERAAHQRAGELGMDLLSAYKNNLESDVRFDLAWMLITNESTEYYQLAKEDIHSVPWPEVRIWVIRRREASLSTDYREKLLELVLGSPTSEAKLVAARWYREQGKITESEDADYAAMSNGLFWDALDAADQLLESERYHDDAVDHLLSVVRNSKHFTSRAAFSLLDLYGVRKELEALVDASRKEPQGGPNRELLVDKLVELTEERVGESRPLE